MAIYFARRNKKKFFFKTREDAEGFARFMLLSSRRVWVVGWEETAEVLRF